MDNEDEEISDAGPILEYVEGSEIEACVDTSALGIDGIFRPMLVSQSGDSHLEITVADARRLLAWLEEAIPWMDGKLYEH